MSPTIIPVLAIAVPVAVALGIAYTLSSPRSPAGRITTALGKASQTIGLATAAPEAWEHGWKTERVIATRYNSPHMGYHIGFSFPKNPYDADRAELSDYLETQQGWVFQGGGAPGAELIVRFKDVTDKATADAKLQALLPDLSRLITRLGNGEKVVIAKPRPKYTWPDTSPIDKSDPYWELNNNSTINGVPYHKIEVSPGRWQWAVNEDAQRRMREYEARKATLFHALTTRVLTDDELKEAAGYGDSLNTQPMVPYYADQKQQELTRAFLTQQMLRAAPPTGNKQP